MSPAEKQNSNSDTQLSISIFLPCYNEQENIRPISEKAVSVLEQLNADWELIIVNDGSSDQTRQTADKLATENPGIKVIHHEQNLGYGAALQSGFKAAQKELVFYTDGDNQFDIGEFPGILPLIRQYDIVSCYRRNRNDKLIRKINGWAWTWLVNILLGLRLKDIDCAFKLYKREIFGNITLTSTGALIDAEVLAKASAKGYTIAQKPVSHYPRKAGKQTGANFGVIVRAFAELIKLTWNFRLKKS